MNRLRVLHCIYDDPSNPWVGGGGARRTFDLYRHLRDEVDVTIATGRFPGSHDRIVDGLRVIRLGAASPYAWSRLRYAAAAARYLRHASYDVALVDHSGYAPVLIPRGRPIGMVVHHLAGPGAITRWGPVVGGRVASFERHVLRRARWFSATSQSTAAELATFLPPTAHISRITSGVPDELFSIARDDRGFALYVGRIDTRQKGLDVLIDAIAAVVHELPDARLKLAGRGPDIDRLRRQAADRGIADAVEFLGQVTDAERNALMAQAGLQVLPSRFEGFGIAAAEALAAGVPLVVSDTPALAEIVTTDGRAIGEIVPAGDSATLARAIAYLLRRPEVRRQLSSDGRAAAERFRWPHVAARHLGFLEQVAGSSPISDAGFQ